MNHVRFDVWKPCCWVLDGAPRDCVTVPEIYAMMSVEMFIGRMMGVET